MDDQAGFVGQVASTITLPEGTGGDGTLTYALSGLPAGLSFDANDREITGTPTASGEYIVTYTVDDEDDDSDSSQFTYRIAGYDQSGRDVVVYAQIIAAAGNDPYPATNAETVGTADLVVDDVNITIDRIRNSAGGADVRLRRTGSGSWQSEFENTGGEYNTGGWQVILALASGNITMDIPGDVHSGTSAVTLRMNVPSGDQADFGALGGGHPFIIVISKETPTTVDYAIDGGDISWIFNLNAPTVTHQLAPVDHAVDGGDISWAFSLPRPRFTHTELLAPVVPIAPRINDQPFRDALISQWRSGSIAPQLIDVMLTATDRLYIANVNLLLKGWI